jgi:uncharacterized membrane protein HdeD (DUF308 family)
MRLIIGIIAIIAGILVLINFLAVNLVIGIFLLIWGILEIFGRGR